MANASCACYGLATINTGMAPTCDWMIKIVKVNKLYLNSLTACLEAEQ